MKTETAGEKRNALSRDLISAAEFFEMLREVVGARERPAIADPLQSAADQIRNNPSFTQSRLLLRILAALMTGGEFRRAEVAVLDAPTQALVIALLDLRRAGARSDHDWSNAVHAAEAASV